MERRTEPLLTVVVTGCSSIGKTTLAKILLAKFPELSLIHSYTTREKRDEDINYYHISLEEFKTGLDNGEFIDHNEVYTNTFYGSKWQSLYECNDLGKTPLLVTDSSGAANYNNITNCLVINLIPKDIKKIKQRILLVRNDRLDERLKTLEHLHLGFGNEYIFDDNNELIEDKFSDIQAHLNKKAGY